MNNSLRVDKPTAAAGVPRLSEPDIKRIADERNRLERKYNYSTAAAPLALARAVRLAHGRGDFDFSFNEAMAWMSLPGRSLLEDYGGGTCMSLAENLSDNLRAILGVPVFVTGQPADNILTRWPSLTAKGLEGNRRAFDALQGISHTNVVVPYRDFSDRLKWLRVVCGTGPSDRPEDFLWSFGHDEFEPEIVENPSRLSAQAIRCLHKIHITDRKSGATAGFDLMRRSLYVNQRALGTQADGRESEASSGDTLDFLADDSADDLQEHVLVRVLLAIVEAFGLSRECEEDLRFFVRHVDTICDEVLVAPAASLSRCIGARDRAVSALEQAEELIGQTTDAVNENFPITVRDLGNAAEALRRAAQCVHETNPQGAKIAYAEAFRLLSVHAPNIRDGRDRHNLEGDQT